MDGNDVAVTGMGVMQCTMPAALANDGLVDHDTDGLVGDEVGEDYEPVWDVAESVGAVAISIGLVVGVEKAT